MSIKAKALVEKLLSESEGTGLTAVTIDPPIKGVARIEVNVPSEHHE